MMKELVLCLYRVGEKNQFQLNDDKIWYFIKSSINRTRHQLCVCVWKCSPHHIRKTQLKGSIVQISNAKMVFIYCYGKKVKLCVYMKIVLTFHCKVATIYHGWIKKDVCAASFLYMYRINVFAEDLDIKLNFFNRSKNRTATLFVWWEHWQHNARLLLEHSNTPRATFVFST